MQAFRRAKQYLEAVCIDYESLNDQERQKLLPYALLRDLVSELSNIKPLDTERIRQSFCTPSDIAQIRYHGELMRALNLIDMFLSIIGGKP